jgi:hypothetical protein
MYTRVLSIKNLKKRFDFFDFFDAAVLASSSTVPVDLLSSRRGYYHGYYMYTERAETDNDLTTGMYQ